MTKKSNPGSRRKKSGSTAKSANAQLLLPFPVVATLAEIPPDKRSEPKGGSQTPIAPIVASVTEVIPTFLAGPPPSDGQRENEYIMRRYDKLESWVFYALLGFVGTFLVDVAVKGGLPVAQAWLKKNDMPTINDVFISGACGLAALVFTGLTAYFYLSLLYYSPQRWFNISTPAHYSRYRWLRGSIVIFKGVWFGALALMMVIIFFLSAADMSALIHSIIWHISPTDWQTSLGK